MNEPTLAVLPADLEAVKARWLKLDRGGRDDLYASEFIEPFAQLFRELPLHGAPNGLPKPRALVSVLGLSWQPVALMAAWCRPETMLVLGTEQSLAMLPGDEGVLSLIARLAGISRDHVTPVKVGDPGEQEIYRAVRDFLNKSQVPARQVFVDPTGGKKSMSASAALAGFLAGAPLVYVDYGEYHGEGRIPFPGTEYPRLLTNPLEVLGDLERRDVFAAMKRSDFQEAERLSMKLAGRLYEPREADCLAKLARGYGAWDRFDFEAARASLREAREDIEQFADHGDWEWAAGARDNLDCNLRVLSRLVETSDKPTAVEEGLPLLAWYLAGARRLLHAEKASLALLLTYAAVERYIDLCLWVQFELDDERPDYSRIREQLDDEAYKKAGQVFHGKNYKPRDPEGPLNFSTGAQLLAALSPDKLKVNSLGPLKGLSADRNKCEYEHGFLPKTPSKDNVQKHLQKAADIIARACCDPSEFDDLKEDCAFLCFEAIADSAEPTTGEN